MIEKRHNENSKQFMKKILIFIDSILLNSVNTAPENVNKTLTTGILNVRDAIIAEVVKDNQIEELNQFFENQELAKKNQEELKENQKDLNQETELVKDQQA